MNMVNSEDSAVQANSENDGSDKSGSNGDAGVLQSLREGARMTTETLYDAGQKASAAIKDFGDNAYQMGSQTGARVVRQVEAQPVAAVLIAASIGMIIGVLLPRR
jgi:ElaB/YqjD/DUF883 family membrane-anchored ribosome-binding protein